MSVCALYAQSNPVKKIPQELYFMIGNWDGQGQFANGKKIEASIAVKLALDSSWLSLEHTDKQPNRYKALTYCGIDRNSGQFLAYTFDNFSGHRLFNSEGWKDNKLILSNIENAANGSTAYQHFIYEKITATSFKMSYEVSKDGKDWRLIDSLVFNKS